MTRLIMTTPNEAIEKFFLFDNIPDLALPEYEFESSYNIGYFINNEICDLKTESLSNNFHLQLQFKATSVSNVSRMLLDYALVNAKSEFLDSCYYNVVCSNDTFPSHFSGIIGSTLPKKCDKVFKNSYLQITRLKNIPKNILYFIPEPEYFGVVAEQAMRETKETHIGGFCLSNFVVKVELSQDEIDIIKPEFTFFIALEEK